MLVKIFYLISMLFGSDVPVDDSVLNQESLLKEASPKFNRYDEIDLSSRLDLSIFEITDPDEFSIFLTDLSHHENYISFMENATVLDEIGKEVSDELRYHILLQWAQNNKQPTVDRQGYFPILSTLAIQNVYIPLARLLNQAFRLGTSSRACLLDICLTSLQNYMSIMVYNTNPYDSKTSIKRYHVDRFPYDKVTLEKVAELEEKLSSKPVTKETEATIRFTDEPKVILIDPNKGFNIYLRKLTKKNEAINQFCINILINDLTLFSSYKDKKQALNALHTKYAILYDFAFDSDYSSKIMSAILFTDNTISTMDTLRPFFDIVWENYQAEVEDFTQDDVESKFFPALYLEFCKVHPPCTALGQRTLRRTKSVMDNLGELEDEDYNNLPSQDQYSPMPDDEDEPDDDGFIGAARQHAASSPQKPLVIPLISVNGQLQDLDQL
ncbi:MAG: hypothetical protein KF820_07165 [Candidatus Paracaedibacteraceae bacterium]|nr:hypothetical protein [Candidatus Paracaedibacteraceae bacterium]